MAETPRYLTSQIPSYLERKMVFVAGPRQVGKTTLARGLPGAADAYLNWDIAEHRQRILRRELPPVELWVFDEIHPGTRVALYPRRNSHTRENPMRKYLNNPARLFRIFWRLLPVLVAAALLAAH